MKSLGDNNIGDSLDSMVRRVTVWMVIRSVIALKYLHYRRSCLSRFGSLVTHYGVAVSMARGHH